MSEGDIITIFSQFGEPVYINLIRDKETGKSKGFAFLKYEDQRSTDLAVDNLGGTAVLGRVLKVDHTRYKRKEDEDTRDNTRGTPKGESGDESQDSRQCRQRRKHIRDTRCEDDGESTPISKEEIELQALIRDHDDDDPMKDYLIRQKREEIVEAKGRAKKKAFGYDEHGRKNRHHDRHHLRRKDRHGAREGYHSGHEPGESTEKRHERRDDYGQRDQRRRSYSRQLGPHLQIHDLQNGFHRL